MQPITDTGRGVKGLIFRGQRVVLLRKPNGQYDLPGGRLEVGELDRDGLDREIREETGLCKVKITNLFIPWTFINHSGGVIKGTTWLCWHSKEEVRLSSEHSDFSWEPLECLNSLNLYRKYALDKLDLRSLKDCKERRKVYAF